MILNFLEICERSDHGQVVEKNDWDLKTVIKTSAVMFNKSLFK